MEAGEILKQVNEVTKDWLHLKIMEAVVKNPELKELTFIKQSMETPDGGKYLISITHVEGPKIQLKKDPNV